MVGAEQLHPQDVSEAIATELVEISMQLSQHADGSPESEGGEVAALLSSLQRGLLRHPAASQQVFRSLVAEGRAYRETEEGRRLEQRLLVSEQFQRLRRIYDSLTWHMFEADGDGPLPAAYIDAIAQVIGADHLEPMLARLLNLRNVP